jgi:hypothetical protein
MRTYLKKKIMKITSKKFIERIIIKKIKAKPSVFPMGMGKTNN